MTTGIPIQAPNYNHPQPNQKSCRKCGTMASMTKGDTSYFMFCPNPKCFNLGARDENMIKLQFLWNSAQTINMTTK